MCENQLENSMAKSETRKIFLKEIRQRLITRDYLNTGINSNDVFFLNNKLLTKLQIEDLTKRVYEISRSQEIVSLKKLIIDQSEFDHLDESGKMRYMMELSNIYIHLKKKIS